MARDFPSLPFFVAVIDAALPSSPSCGTHNSMNKSELIQALAEKSDIAPDLARDVVETTIAMMKQQLRVV